MAKYYVVVAYLVNGDSFFAGDVRSYKKAVRIKDPVIATKTLLGYKEIVTGRKISNVRIVKKGDNMFLSGKFNKLKRKKVLIVTSDKANLVRPVENLEEVKKYLELDVSKEIFERLDNEKELSKGLEYMHRAKKINDNIYKIQSAISRAQEKFTRAIKEIQRQDELNKEIKQEIKKHR